MPNYVRDYFSQLNGTELSARGAQLRDFLKSTDPNYKFTGATLKQAIEDYMEAGPLDNNIKDFYNSVSDWEQAAQWINKYSTSLVLPAVLIETQNDKQ